MLQSTRFLAARSSAARSLALVTCARKAIGSGPLADADSCAPARAAIATMASAAIATKIVRGLNMCPHFFGEITALPNHGHSHLLFARTIARLAFAKAIRRNDRNTEITRAAHFLLLLFFWPVAAPSAAGTARSL